MLTRRHCPLDVTPTVPPHLRPHHSLRFHTPPLTILTLPQHPQDIPPTPPSTLLRPHPLHCFLCLHSHSALPTFFTMVPLHLCPHQSLCFRTPPLKILMLLRHPQDMPPTLPSTLLILSTNYHPYSLAVSS
ncbi:hypothetical protein O181_052949 [Austropuccinia psidii MF-1]|uniref:Uncharacterized protein n=1 Tax=Austropuccinia psidii MF-1 TaxID=1389203 RepID=A0A9Q3HS70_9BASI|nr:hypothetical protein [Austropuccinia psidii MF-1]